MFRILIGLLFTLAGTHAVAEVCYKEDVKYMWENPALPYFQQNFVLQGTKAVSSGCEIQLPIAFEDGVGLTFHSFADLAKVNALLAKEDPNLRALVEAVRDPKTGQVKQMAKVEINFTRYTRTAYGPALVARINFLLQIVNKQLPQDLQDKMAQKKVSYAKSSIYWRYYEGGSGPHGLAGGRELVGLPKVASKVSFDRMSNPKVMSVETLNGDKLLDAKFLMPELPEGKGRTVFEHAMVVAITPGNLEFDPDATADIGRRNNVTWLNGMSYAPVKYNSATDQFLPQGQLKADLDSIGFVVGDGLSSWVLSDYYRGIFEKDSVTVGAP